MMMMLIVLTSLPAADCSAFLLLRREKLDHQWFEAGSVVQLSTRIFLYKTIDAWTDGHWQKYCIHGQTEFCSQRTSRVNFDRGCCLTVTVCIACIITYTVS